MFLLPVTVTRFYLSFALLFTRPSVWLRTSCLPAALLYLSHLIILTVIRTLLSSAPPCTSACFLAAHMDPVCRSPCLVPQTTEPSNPMRLHLGPFSA